MEYLLIIFILGAVLYYLSDGIEAKLNVTNQNMQIYARNLKADNQDKIKKLEKKVSETIKKNDGWYTLDYVDSIIKKNIKKE